MHTTSRVMHILDALTCQNFDLRIPTYCLKTGKPKNFRAMFLAIFDLTTKAQGVDNGSFRITTISNGCNPIYVSFDKVAIRNPDTIHTSWATQKKVFETLLAMYECTVDIESTRHVLDKTGNIIESHELWDDV